MRICWLLFYACLSSQCVSQTDSSQHQPQSSGAPQRVKTESLPNLSSWTIRERGQQVKYDLLKLPITPTSHIEQDRPGHFVQKGIPDNTVYVLLRSAEIDKMPGRIVWLYYSSEKNGETAMSVIAPTPEMAWGFGPSAAEQDIYLAKGISFGGHSTVLVYEIDRAANYGKYPPLSFNSAVSNENGRPRAPEPIIRIDPSKALNDLVVGVSDIHITGEDRQLILTFKAMRASATVELLRYAIDVASRKSTQLRDK